MSNKENSWIGLFNPKSPSNVGAVLRAAGCYSAKEVFYTGERFNRASKYQTDTKNMSAQIPLRQTDDLLNGLPEGASLVCVELVEGAISLPKFEHPKHAVYIFGPEDGSLPQALIDQADAVVYVPTIGCMNLAASVNVVLYDRLAKSGASINHSQRVLHSRDRNNRLRLRTSK